MFGNRPARVLTAEESRRACDLAVRVEELSNEAQLLRGLAAFESDPVMMGLYHDLIRQLGDDLDLLHVEQADPCSVLGRASI